MQSKKMSKTGNGYYRGQHSYFLLQYHLVLVTRFRQPVITGDVEMFLREYANQYFGERNAPIVSMEITPDCMRIMFDTTPTKNLGEFVNAFKTASSRMVRSRFPEQLSRWYDKPTLWSSTYFIGSVSDRTTKSAEHYIETQKDKN